MLVCCVFSLESPLRGDSNEYTQYTIFNIKKKNTINYPKSAGMGFISKGLKNEFKTAVVNEPSMFELLKFYCFFRFLTRKYSVSAAEILGLVLSQSKRFLLLPISPKHSTL